MKFSERLKTIRQSFKALFRALRHPGFGGVAICFLVFGLVLAIRAVGWLQRPELIVYDHFLRRQVSPQTADDRIKIIGMTEADLREYGFPLDDEHLAQILEKIGAAKPCVVGLDLYRDLPEPRDGSQYARLAEVLRKDERIIAIERVGFVDPPKALAEAPEQVTGNNLPKDYFVDGVYRRGPLFIEIRPGEKRVSFSLMLAQHYLDAQGVEFAFERAKDEDTGKPIDLLRLGKTLIPRLSKTAGGYVNSPQENYEFLANFEGPHRHGHQATVVRPGREQVLDEGSRLGRNTAYDYSFGEVLKDELPPGALAGKIVLLATVMESIKDSNPTPIDDNLRGVQYHAMLVHQLLEIGLAGRAPMRWWPEWAEVLWIAGCTLLGGLLGLWLRSPWKLAPALLCMLAGIFFGGQFAFQHGLWLLVAAPIFGALVAAAAVTSYVVGLERADRRVMQSLFSKHVSKKVADVLFREREQFMDGGRMAARAFTGTVVFTDLAGFSTASETLTAGQIITWLNEYMEPMVEIVESYEGTVNKFIGDAIMAVFGAPVLHQTEEGIRADTIRAVRCALGMRKAVPILNARWRAADSHMPSVAMRVGIFTGQLVHGSMGAADRLEWTVIGDTVNRANRLEAAGKEVKNELTEEEQLCPILIGPEVFSRVGDLFETRPVPDMALKGITERVTVYRVLSERVPTATT